MHQRTPLAHVARIAVLLTGMLLGRADADEIKPLPPDGVFYGQKLSDWAVSYYQWLFSIPWTVNPSTGIDKTGKGAGIGQRSPVWFIPSFNPGENGTRTILIPEGQAILVSPASSSARQQPGEATDGALMALLDEAVAVELQPLTRLEVSLDGVSVPDLNAYRVRTPVFSLLPPPGFTTWMGIDVQNDARLATAVEGYFVMFPALPVGKHVLSVRREGGNAGNSRWTFNLFVQKPNERPQ